MEAQRILERRHPRRGRLIRRRRSPTRRRSPRRTPLAPPTLVRASDAQRAKVGDRGCAVCGRVPADPAHLVPQRLGGCAHRDCVIPLCRTHHRLYDSGELRLRPYLDASFRSELAHATTHVAAVELNDALNGNGWPRRSTRVLLGRRGYRPPRASDL